MERDGRVNIAFPYDWQTDQFDFQWQTRRRRSSC